MSKSISSQDLNNLLKHTKLLGLKSQIKRFKYTTPLTLERCAELPYIINLLKDLFHEKFNYLDIGTGESPLPSYFLSKTKWDISCIDKFDWIDKQVSFAKNLPNLDNDIIEKRFHIYRENFLDKDFGDKKFDLITNVSVIEHLEGSLDTEMMIKTGKLLKPGGRLILTTPINEDFYQEFYLKSNVYGENYNNKSVYYQRHYDSESIKKKLVEPSNLKKESEIFFGEYGFQSFEKLMQNKSQYFRTICQFFTKYLAKTFISYRKYPLSRPDMQMNTSSGVILELVKPID